MAKTETLSKDLRKGAKVVAREAMRDVPEGTTGKVSMVTGITWIRYWVRFDNGVSIGSVNRKRLATPDEWQRYQAGEEEVELDVADDASGDDGTAEAAAVGDAGATTASGTFVPQKHLDRAKAARARLGG